MARTVRGLRKRGGGSDGSASLAGASGSAIDPRDEPSAEWGWHGNFPVVGRIAGLLSALALLTMLIGPHRGQIEDLWLVGIAALMFFYLLRNTLRARRAWRGR